MQRSHRSLILLLALSAACSEDASPAPADDDAADIGGADDADPADAGEPEGDSEASDAPEVEAASCGDGACDPEEDAEGCPIDCNPAPVGMHDPTTGELFAFPDDFFTIEDADTVTGERVHITPATLPSLEDFPAGFRGVFTDLSTLDGFGTTAGAFLRFTRPLDLATVPSGLETGQRGQAVIFGVLGPGGFERVPVEVKATDEGATLILRPMAPLPPASRALAAITTQITGADGRPVEAGAYTRRLLAGGQGDRVGRRAAEAVEALVAAGEIDAPEALAGLLTFTTQSIVEESLAVAEDIRARPHPIVDRGGCTPSPNFTRCTFRFEAGHYRTPERALAQADEGGPLETYAVTASAFLPLEPGPYGTPAPVILFGHGLNGERDQARRLADFAAPLGIATIAIDAPEHGDHPAHMGNNGFLGLMSFFGFDARFNMRALALRDNWRQATFDKLALIEALKAEGDIDGDGLDDLDGARIMYLGVSLGGIMAPELLALTQDIEAAVLVVPGGRVTDIMQFGSLFSPLVRLLTPAGVGSGDVDRFWPILQTAIERGDAANWAPHVLDRRLVGQGQSVLFGMVLDDEIVPEPANFLLARALGIAHMPPQLRPIGLVPEGGPLPTSGNLPGGRTAGLLQFDLVFEEGAWEAATHNNIGASGVGAEAWLRFLEGWLRDGQAVIVDPYAGLDRP